jgi:MtN3 and saliva related transmembrane protein
MPDAAAIVGTIAATLSVVSFTPQAWRIISTGETEGLSARMYVLTSLGFVMWTIFGVLRGEWAIIIPNTLCLSLALFILAMLLMPDRKRAQLIEAANLNAARQSEEEPPGG